MLKWNEFDRSHKIFVWMTGIFLVCLIIANLIGAMLFSFRLPFLKDPVLLSAGIIPFPVTFILTDLLNEFYGKQGARFVTFVGFGMSILVFLLLLAGSVLPVDSRTVMPQNVYQSVFELYSGMFVASLIAYLIAQLLDIQIFQIFRSITRHRFIWLRATGSTVISQLFDSLVITFIAFHANLFSLHATNGAVSVEFFPGSTGFSDWLFKFSLPVPTLWELAFGNYTWKFVIAVGITPFLYLGHYILARLMPRQEQALEGPSPEQNAS